MAYILPGAMPPGQPSWSANGRAGSAGYPPIAPVPYNPNSSTTLAMSEPPNDATNPRREAARTPSPTPTELKALKGGVLDWKSMKNWRFWIRKEWTWYYVALVIILTLTALITLYHKQIVDWLTPVTKWLHDLRFGWLVPIGVLFVLSFPPLFGHEIVAILCGLVWGLWIGFGIVAAGTFLGELGNFYAFKYCCRARGEKLERTRIPYACLAKVVRQGGFKIALIARLSAIPGHFTTAIFSTCGMGIITFSIAAILSSPKQFITVYLGVILEQSDTGTTNTKSRIISDVVLVITFIITIAAMWYIWRKMEQVKAEVIYERRKARQGKIARYDTSDLSFIENGSTSQLPLTNVAYPFASQYQESNVTFAPRPQRANYQPSNNYGFTKHEELGSDESVSSDSHVPRRGYQPARQSTDEVGWELGHYSAPVVVSNTQGHYSQSPPNLSQQALPPALPPPPSSAPPSQLYHTQSPSSISPQQIPQQSLPPTPTMSSPVQQTSTPRQASYPHVASPNQPSSPLPMPPFPISPPPRRQHLVEPSDMSYSTAVESHESSDVTEYSPGTSGESKPPPPSYHI